MTLSARQRALWHTETVVRGTSMLALGRTMRLRGPLDVAALCRAVRELSQRQQILRAGFAGDSMSGDIRVAAATPPELTVLDCADQAAAWTRLESAWNEPFPFDGSPLVRMTLVRLAPDDFYLQVVLHQMVCDGPSLSVLFNDLSKLYAAERDSRPAALPDLPAQYADLAAAERDRDRAERAWDYWNDRLAGLPELRLGGDRDGGEEQEFDATLLPLGPAAAGQLETARAALATTPFLLLTSALLNVLHRRTGQTDLRVGTTFVNRIGRRGRHLVGPLSQGMVLRVDVGADPSLAGVHEATRAAFVAALAQQALPFDELVARLENGGLPREQLMPVTVAVDCGVSVPDLSGVEVEPAGESGGLDVLSTGLGLVLGEDANEPALGLAYSTAHYSTVAAQALLTDVWAEMVGRAQR